MHEAAERSKRHANVPLSEARGDRLPISNETQKLVSRNPLAP
jgi:hypothetical protein